jgi:hypothetical protein
VCCKLVLLRFVLMLFGAAKATHAMSDSCMLLVAEPGMGRSFCRGSYCSVANSCLKATIAPSVRPVTRMRVLPTHLELHILHMHEVRCQARAPDAASYYSSRTTRQLIAYVLASSNYHRSKNSLSSLLN